MTRINWQDFKCRCSSITQMLSESRSSAALTEKQVARLKELDAKPSLTENMKLERTELIEKQERSKEVVLSETCISYLMEVYAWETQKMISVSKEMDIEQMQKGKIVEPESIALLSIVDGVNYEKNTERFYNDYLSGEPDIVADKVIDVKSSFDYPCFLKKINVMVESANKTQIQGYLDLLELGEGEVADCLVSMPETMINDYRRRLLYKMNVISDEAPEYKEAEAMMLNSMIFDKIPRHQRVFKKKVVPFTDFERQKIYDKVKICRTWLSEFDEMYQKLNK